MSLESDIIDDENDWSEYVSLREDSFDVDPKLAPPSPVRPREEHQQHKIPLSPSNKSLCIEMPQQLHPACSIGLKKVSSCYFSLASANDHESVSDLLSQLGDDVNDAGGRSNENESNPIDESVNVFYHDVLMEVFTFLDAKSLMNFSETARVPNFEVFYFLQLRLQQALLLDNSNGNDRLAMSIVGKPDFSTIEGSASLLSRVATLDMKKARDLVEEYQDSNSTLRTMPLSYSLAYVRHYLLRNGFHNFFFNNNESNEPNNEIGSTMAPTPQTLASAAVFMTVVGAASIVSSSDASAITTMTDRLGSDLPNVLFRVGFVGSLMRAISDTDHGTAMREKAEQMARSVQAVPAALMPGRRNGQQGQHEHESQVSEDTANPELQSQTHPTPQRTKFLLPSLFEMKHMLQDMVSNAVAAEKQREQQTTIFGPYDHLPPETGTAEQERGEKKEQDACDAYDADENDEQPSTTQWNDPMHVGSNSTANRKMPSGCVGAYSRAIHRAADFVTERVRKERKSAFQALSPEDQRFQSLRFLNACTSNDTLDDVKEMIASVDVDQFYVGNDGVETCALHSAAFNGADRVVEFLCAGIDHRDPCLDGGLCDVNARDENGWTALHFAAGSNSIAAVRVLARHGAVLDVEAHNGYTPLSWANRLSNDGVAEVLKERMEVAAMDQSNPWMSRQPLASIANRFFSLIPSR